LQPRAWKFFRALVRHTLGLEDAGEVRRLAGGAGTWDLGALASREGLASFLSWGIHRTGSEGSFPGDFLEALSRNAALERDHLVRVYLVAVRSLEILKSLGIPALVVKGLAIAPYWPVHLLRFMSDVDLVVPWEERKRMWASFQGIRQVQERLGVTAEVEPLHHDLTAGNTIDLDFGQIFSRARTGRVGGLEAMVASPLDLALGTASSALRHDPRSLRLLLDLAFLFRSGDLDTEELARESRRLGLDRVLAFLFLQLQGRFGLSPGEDLLSPGRDPKLERKLGLCGEEEDPAPCWFAGPGLFRVYLKLRLENPFRYLRRSLTNFFPPPLSLRNQFIREGRQKDFLPLLYLSHWRRRLGSLASRKA